MIEENIESESSSSRIHPRVIKMSRAASSLVEKVRPILTLYRQILRTHVAVLPEPMKTLGDKYVQAELPSYGKVDLGDPRIRGTDSLSHLISAAFPNAKVTVETNVVSLEGPPTELAETAAGFFYAAFTLPTEIRRAMLSELSDLLASSERSENAVEKARFSMPINRLLVFPSTK